MPIMASYNNNNGLESPNSRKRKQDLQYHVDYDLDYYQPEQQFYPPSSSSSSNLMDFHHQQNSFLYNNDYTQEKRYDDRSNSTFQKPTLHLDDLDQRNHQKELIQAWSMSGSTTENQGGTNTPGFFSPGFLEALQHENDVKSLGFPFHTSNPHPDFIIGQPTMVPERSLIQESTATGENSAFGHLISQSNPNSTSSSPMIHVGRTSALSQIENILTTSSVSSSSSTSSPPLPIASNFTPTYVPPFNAIAEDPWVPETTHPRRLNKSTIDDSKLQPIIKNYLANHYMEDERTVIILTSKVAQKSYGTEKRFLCPPPTAILIGTNWWTPSNAIDHHPQEVLDLGDGTPLHPPKLTVSMSGDVSSQSGQIEWYTVSGASVGVTGHTKPQTTEDTTPSHPSRFRSSVDAKTSTEWYNNQGQELLSAGKCVSKHLYINDADEKRKRVESLVRIQLANGIQLGTLASKGIKVISKPSKKRQSVKNLELCIHHGATVSLFNRIRSQTVSTKYLGVSSSQISFPGQPYQPSAPGDGTCFVARTASWDPFIIWIVDTSGNNSEGESAPTHPNYPPPPAIALKNRTNQLIPIHYNQHIVLQCLTTGLVSPVMVIRKVDKASTVVGGATKGHSDDEEVLGDPVSQLHKVALQIVQQQRTYLACMNDMVGMHKTTEPRHPVAVTSTEGGKVVRKRRVSTDQQLQDYYMARKSSISSIESISANSSGSSLGACWQEDVSDAAVWTIVGTESETYTFLSSQEPMPSVFPSLSHYTTKLDVVHLHGENFSRDLQVWFGEVKALSTEYKSRELMVCKLPFKVENTNQVPILLVKGDGTICKTGKFYPL